MAIAFPDSWSGLGFPFIRSELIETLKDLASLPCPRKNFEVDLEEVIHFFFDDTDLSDAETCVGSILFSGEEVSVIEKLVKVLDIFVSFESRVTTGNQVDEHWEDIVQTAAEACEIFARPGAPIIYGG